MTVNVKEISSECRLIVWWDINPITGQDIWHVSENEPEFYGLDSNDDEADFSGSSMEDR